MPPPSALAIKTSSVIRLVKEEASYHKEAAQQKAQVEKLEADGADEYELRQPKKALEETLVMAPAVRKRLASSLELLQMALDDASEAETAEAKEKAAKALEDGRKVLKEYGEYE
ncbi:uncharacterized protein LAJ45_07864 [Morchella importuna]|uniref:Tubulin-specific chaperone A n=1 Tax=Morchella conica CCBAS932 TaxID=1392247 RepID=A0A3N4KPV2_9PEZI|nr:uncharacterized protein H6S33_012595 [Morchella sextelata]XP_045969404.1 uncharacterized protein LAJ45_07864 [Morchella importuna]KAH0610049.1 hypothetical protein H6S33_012595 [Morchella sextelata]KAH8148100.1 hypothetical protein LAJ45_07864 [Morchella importuna]RPB11459.1 tubulin binding cofactor A [Morchella conica CCBAS932]